MLKYSCFRSIMSRGCLECNLAVEKQLLVDHLFQNDECRIRYMIRYSVNTFDDLLVALFTCLNCHLTNGQLKRHLQEDHNCFLFYCDKYSTDNLETILKMHHTVRRSLFPSRGKEARAAENRKRTLNIPLFKSLNDYKFKIAWANYKLCCMCKSNFNESAARDIHEIEMVYQREELGSIANKGLRRMEKFSICTRCNNAVENENALVEDSYNNLYTPLTEICADNTAVFSPYTVQVESCEDRSIEETCIFIWIPESCQNYSPPSSSAACKMNLRYLVYQNKNITRKEVSLIYENELYKLQSLIKQEKRFVGSLLDITRKTVTNLTCLKRSRFYLPCSSSWYNNHSKQVSCRQDQLGSLFVTFKIEIPDDALEVVATCLVQDGFVVSIDTEGSSTGESGLRYIVHLDHKSNEDCSDECVNRVELQEILSRDLFDKSCLRNKFAGTYVSSVHLRLAALVSHVIKAPQSGLCAEDYHLMVVYNDNGRASIVGCIWPKNLGLINTGLAANDGELLLKDELAEFVKRNFFVTSNTRYLSENASLTLSESSKVIDLVMNCQLHMCSDEICVKCCHPKPPSLKLIMKEMCSLGNIMASKEFNKWSTRSLVSLTKQEKMTLTTQQWLDVFLNNFHGEIDEDDRITLSCPDGSKIRFEIDSRLVSYFEIFENSLEALYHYSISCCVAGEDLTFIFQRLLIQECYIDVYNPFLLTAANSNTVIELSRSNKMFEWFTSRAKDILSDHEAGITHRRVAIQEAIALFDRTKRMYISSSPIAYVDACPSRKIYFKKTAAREETTFEDSETGELYEMQHSIISRHFMRLNGLNILLAETIIYFDYVGSEESARLFHIYHGNISSIPESSVACAIPTDESEMLPSLLLCTNKDVLKIRKQSKILSTPTYKSSYDYQYSRVMLFYPIKDEDELLRDEDLSSEKVSELFLQMDSMGNDTVVRCNERY